MQLMDQTSFRPSEARRLEETGLSHTLLVDLVLRCAFLEGTILLSDLVERLKLPSEVVESLYRYLYEERLCESRSYENKISLNSKGRSLAEVALKKTQYVGPAPVPLKDYTHAVTLQALRLDASPERLRSALNDLVLADRIIKELGSALLNRGTILLYGSTGNGKTSVAERFPRLFDDSVYIPYAVEVSGQIVSVFDPLVHQAALPEPATLDRRWLLCKRPMVKVGGELRLDMLDTRVDEATRICTAPVQMKANNGILLIDDFGRQRITPRELLNRWIVPLDRGNDILSLPSGFNFEIPFELLVVFATNLSLTDLAEDAFIRRLKNKIKIDTLSSDLFRTLLKRVCKEGNIPCSAETQEYIIQQCLEHSPDALRGCFPTDLVSIACGNAAFDGRRTALDKASVDEVINMYFAR